MRAGDSNEHGARCAPDDRCQDAPAAITAAALPAVTFVRIFARAGWFHREHGKASK